MLESSIYRERYLHRRIRRLAGIVLLLSAMILLLSAVIVRQAIGATACAEAPNQRGGWSYRIIDGRRCWFLGRHQLPKESLFWPDKPKGPPAGNQIDVEKAAPSAAKAEIYFPALHAGDALAPYPPLTWHQPWLSSASMMHWPLLMDIDRQPFIAWDRRIGQ